MTPIPANPAPRNPSRPAAAAKPKPTLILGVETSTPNGGVALIDEERCLGSFTRWGGRLHSQRVMSGLRDILRDLGLSPADLTAIAVSIGPGSFTGVRVGLAAAKALAHGVGIPLIGVPTLEAFALRALGVDDRGGLNPAATVCPILDARRGEVYWAAFEVCPGASEEVSAVPANSPRSSDGSDGSDRSDGSDGSDRSNHPSETAACPPADLPAFRRLAPDAMTKAVRIGHALAELQPETREYLVCGEGALHAREALLDALGGRVHFAPPHRMMAGPEEVAWLGLRRFREGLVVAPAALAPVYLREPDVQFPRTLQRQRED